MVRATAVMARTQDATLTLIEEHAAYHSATPVTNPQTLAHIELVRKCTALVFVYPTWWSAQPAILKGWLERVMVPGVAFGFDARNKVVPALTGVKRIVVVSTYGSPRPYVALVNDNGRRILSRALRMSCGWRTRVTALRLFSMDTQDDAGRERHLRRIDSRMRAL